MEHRLVVTLLQDIIPQSDRALQARLLFCVQFKDERSVPPILMAKYYPFDRVPCEGRYESQNPGPFPLGTKPAQFREIPTLRDNVTGRIQNPILLLNSCGQMTFRHQLATPAVSLSETLGNLSRILRKQPGKIADDMVLKATT